MSLPLAPTTGFGTVTGRVIRAVGDTADAGSDPDMLFPVGKVRFVPDVEYVRIPSAAIAGGPAIMVPEPVECPINNLGYITNPGNLAETAVKLVATNNTANAPYNWEYIVQFQLDSGVQISDQRIQVPGGATVDLAVIIATAAAPEVAISTAISLANEAMALAQEAYDLASAAGGGGGGGGFTMEQIQDDLGNNVLKGTAGQINVFYNDTSNTVVWSLISGPLTQIIALTPAANDILQYVGGAWANRTMAQLKTSLALTKSDVALGSVDNTADTAKPVSTAQAAAIALKANIASPVFTGTVTLPGAPTVPLHAATKAYVDTATAAASDAFEVVWTGTIWPTRPVVSHPYKFISTTDPLAPPPPDAVLGDMWIRHPLAA